MRSLLLAAVLFAVAGCASHQRSARLQPSVATSPTGLASVLVGAEQGLPVTVQSEQGLLSAWHALAQKHCAGPYAGYPELQLTSFAQPGEPFADPFASGVYVAYTAAFGQIRCTSLLAASAP